MAADATEGEMEQLSALRQSCPRDLLKRFGGSSSCHDVPPVIAAREEVEEIELSLGLSLGGCFGVEPQERRLVRSSSVATLSMRPVEHDFPVAAPLTRTCSLPTETEEEYRKRKELQSLKRLEAKRKRSEKRNLSRLVPSRDQRDENFDEGANGGHGRELAMAVKEELSGCTGVPGSNQARILMNAATSHGLPGWAATPGSGSRPADASGICFRPASQGSIGSQGSGSSSASDFKGHPVQGSNGIAEDRSASTPPPLLEHANHKAASSPAAMAVGKLATPVREEEESSKKTAGGPNEAVTREMERSMMEEMPCVSTTGDGPNGRRIEGFLYRYRKGEEVRIVCVCHGDFLTPAEFVRHAGGGEVAHPLRHIVVNPTSSAFF